VTAHLTHDVRRMVNEQLNPHDQQIEQTGQIPPGALAAIREMGLFGCCTQHATTASTCNESSPTAPNNSGSRGAFRRERLLRQGRAGQALEDIRKWSVVIGGGP
jgi:hypothetical protein